MGRESTQFNLGSKGFGTKDNIRGVIRKSILDIYFLSDIKINAEKMKLKVKRYKNFKGFLLVLSLPTRK